MPPNWLTFTVVVPPPVVKAPAVMRSPPVPIFIRRAVAPEPKESEPALKVPEAVTRPVCKVPALTVSGPATATPFMASVPVPALMMPPAPLIPAPVMTRSSAAVVSAMVKVRAAAPVSSAPPTPALIC